jgi:hypothetical protein
VDRRTGHKSKEQDEKLSKKETFKCCKSKSTTGKKTDEK